MYVDGLPVPNYENRDPAPRYQLPLSVEDSMKFIHTPAEFSVQLFAAEPDIVKPISFNFDERGRMWLLETVDYPNKILNGQPGDDRIRILEDTNGDGRADKFTVFADRLNIPTSLTFANGGAIVSQAPHILFLKDTNGDDKADVREVLSTGWGTGDTHAGPSNLQYGPDNFIWGSVGYSGFKGQMNGKPLQFAQGLFRFRPDGRDFEFVTASTNNTWGLGFTENVRRVRLDGEQRSELLRGDSQPLLRGRAGTAGRPRRAARATRASPRFYARAPADAVHPAGRRARRLHRGGGASPLHRAGVSEGVLEPHRVHHRADGASRRPGDSREAGRRLRDARRLEPVRGGRGVDRAGARAGRARRRGVGLRLVQLHHPAQPDAAGLQQRAGERLRDVAARSAARTDLSRRRTATRRRPSGARCRRTDPAGLLEALASDNMFWRLTAQRLLVERGQKDVVPQLLALVRNPSVDAIGINGGAFHALWTLKGSASSRRPGTDAYRAAIAALKHPAAGVRKAAAMVLPQRRRPRRARSSPGCCSDPDLHTRLAAALALADMPASPDIGAALYTRKPEAGELRGPLVEPRALHRRDAPQGGVPDVVPRGPEGVAVHRSAGAAAARRDEAGLARAARRRS